MSQSHHSRYFATCNGQTVRLVNVYNRTIGYDDKGKYIAGVGGNCTACLVHEVEREISYKNLPSNHKCDARCQNAKGNKCECSCGGKNHGRS